MHAALLRSRPVKILIEVLLSLALLAACALAAQTADRVARLQEQPEQAVSCAQAPCDTVLLATAQSDIDRARKTPLKTP